jgi:predicted nucleotidyltransferase
LRSFRRDVERALPGRVSEVVLFGSRARGDARRDSDYDVAVFVVDLDDRRSVDHLLADVAYPHILAGVHIRPVAVPSGYMEAKPRDALAASIAREGVPIS